MSTNKKMTKMISLRKIFMKTIVKKATYHYHLDHLKKTKSHFMRRTFRMKSMNHRV